MEILKKNKKKILIFLAAALLAAHIASCESKSFYEPKTQKQDIGAVLEKEEKTKSDYDFLFSQTGLSKSAIDELLENGKEKKIYEISEQYFSSGSYEREAIFFPIVAAEQRTDGAAVLAPLKRGDILISLSTHTLGFRHGHAGMVLNGKTGEILEHFVIGETSKKGRAYSFRCYPTLAVLRFKDQKVANAAADYAEENLIGIVYNPLAGIIKKDKSDEEIISSSQCAHLVWQAYKAVGVDIDGNGGRMVLPADFLKCKDLEIVQIIGIKPPKR